MILDCVSVANMRQSDRHTIASGTSPLKLIARAAYGVYCSVKWHGKVAILAGSGNNGADGFALACILQGRGVDCTVYMVSDHLHQDAAYYEEQAKAVNVPVLPYDVGVVQGYDMIVDCMLGTGFTGGVKPRYKAAIEEVNASCGYVVSVDINSGLNGDTGEGETVVCSDHTVTIGYIKRGLIAEAAGEYMKKLTCIDIGIGLLEKEDLLCHEERWQRICRENRADETAYRLQLDGRTYHRCPPWVDMRVERYIC